MPKPEAFETGASHKCKVCSSPEITEWLHESLAMNLKKKTPRPQRTRIGQRLNELFPAAAVGDEALKAHLQKHEPLWSEWNVKAQA